MKIGIIGVGKWGRTLARKLTSAGAEIVAHDRATDMVMPDRFGPRVPWKDMVEGDEVDAVVAATPPDVTADIFRLCQAAMKPCLLTKPLLVDRGSEVTTTTYVDYVHLFSPLWSCLREMLQESDIASMSAVSTGSSSPRAFPASLDYGPHAISLLLDALEHTRFGLTTAWQFANGPEVKRIKSILARQPEEHENLWVEMEIAGGIGPGIRSTLSCGNMGPRATIFFAKLEGQGDVTYSEHDGKASLSIDGKVVIRDDEHDPLARMLERFMWDVTSRNVDDRYVRLSAAISSVLTEARDHAE